MNTSGSFNTALGSTALFRNTAGCYNVSVGQCTLCSNTTGLSNTAVGYLAGQSATTASYNTFVGSQAGLNLTTGSGNTLIGFRAGYTCTSLTNTVIISNSGGGACFSGAYAGWSSTSDCRLKECIQDLPYGLAFVNGLRPVSWVWNNNELNPQSRVGLRQAGLVAQEVLALQEKNDASYLRIGNDYNPDELGVSLEATIPVLINAIKELSAELTALKTEVATLKQQA